MSEASARMLLALAIEDPEACPGALACAEAALVKAAAEYVLERSLLDPDGEYVLTDELGRMLEDDITFRALGAKLHRYMLTPERHGGERWQARVRIPKPKNRAGIGQLQEPLIAGLVQQSDDEVARFLDQHAQRVPIRELRAHITGRMGRLFVHRGLAPQLAAVAETMPLLLEAGHAGQVFRDGGPSIIVSTALRDPFPEGRCYIVVDGATSYDNGRLRVELEPDYWTFFQHERMQIIDPSGVLCIEDT